MNENEIQYFNQSIRRAVLMERLKANHVKDMSVLFSQVDEYLNKTLYSAESITPALIKEVESGLADIYKQFGEDFKESMVEAFVDSYHFEAASVANAFPVATEAAIAATPAVAKLSKTALEYIEQKPLLIDGLRGQYLSDLLDEFTTAEAKRVSHAIRAGHFEGKTVAELKRQIRGSRATGYRDGILSTTSRHAEAVVRTGLQQAACDARMEFGKDNSDIVEGIQIVATLDSRTSAICKSLDHQVFKLADAKYPPFHVNCRSSYIFVLKKEYRGKDIKGKRASKDGYVDNQSYYQWLKSQPESFQDNVLGKVRAKLFREGGLAADEFAALNLNKNFEPLTLAEMKKLNPLAFEKAGITGYGDSNA